MSEQEEITAKIKKGHSFSAVWILPIVSLAIGIWMFYQYQSNQGTLITLYVKTAEGIEAGKTEIRALSVKVGEVTEVSLNDDYSAIVLKARMDKDANRMLLQDSTFWVVKPRIGKEGVSGLQTLLSGAYIALRPGQSEETEDTFTVLEVPPVAPPDAKGLRVVLSAQKAGKLSVGDPVLFDGFTVGRVENVSFDIEKQKAAYQLFVFEPYDSLIRSETRFWLTSGLNIKLNAQGFDVEVASLESLISGGVTFAVPNGQPSGHPVTEQMTSFRLFDDIKQVQEQMYDNYLEYALLFGESVRGLNHGAPVEYRGIRIGTVEKVPLHLNDKKHGFASKQIPVLIHIEIERILEPTLTITAEELIEDFDNEFKNGLRATLKTGNLLTGALYIDTDFYKDEVDKNYEKSYRGYRNFPTVSGDFVQFQRQIGSILNKLNNLPVENVLTSLDGTLKTTQQTIGTVNDAAKELDSLLKRLDNLAKKDETQKLPKEIRETLQQLQITLKGFSPDSASYQQLQDTMKSFNDAMDEFGPLMKKLNQKPDALIFGENPEGDPVPVKGSHK
ncbi:intermembrane transport protein PqiB [Enterovibrio sp. ZSDZ35]|uniref:Intermembrane transport protein PqiB n=1 Tax=Enterovibrio qingdaonensis TaxID=2899818 RepID=A0ABT5QI71_9GAMM|nr:intermembrane transport protein PqiB [Enterovibrio sp. ZSDZ35]MDD1780684.1 intermembrane transport protein PqiB [Enterovibrio sp. ZSDZ35]